jgi:hypothetical protein
MPCSREGAKAAMLEMAGMPGFPRKEEPDRKRLAIDVISKWAKSDEHALSMAIYIRTNSEFFPAPHLIHEAAKAVMPPTQGALSDENCPLCDGTGWRQGTERGSPDKGFHDVIYAGVRPCKCRKVVPNWEALGGKEG